MNNENPIEQQTQPTPTGTFKVNIYPVMYWALAYGITVGIILSLVYLLAQYITIIWPLIFLFGIVWGGYRNYKKQKNEWHKNTGIAPTEQSPAENVRQAVSDIAVASRDLIKEEDTSEESADEQTPFSPTK